MFSIPQRDLISLPDDTLGKESIEERAKVANWWMQDFQSFVHDRIGTPEETIRKIRAPSDTYKGHRHPLRHLNCFNFRWYLLTLDTDKLISGYLIKRGYLIQRVTGLTLAKGGGNQVIGLKSPTANHTKHEHNDLFQFWYLVDTGELRTENGYCMDNQTSLLDRKKAKRKKDILRIEDESEDLSNVTKVFPSENELKGKKSYSDVVLFPCKEVQYPEQWTITKRQQLLHIPSEKCLQSEVLDNSIYILRLEPCDHNTSLQHWQFSRVNPLDNPNSLLMFGD
ncbi:polypeptide n-acetylgalactosaminyltransferase [Plakobranchus ocellatus]|uniref:Polypeptide n-acetylgalactosaminyltransferase n=1 Tax=Plakobranchus ocellatus TaxID=259542 RepID=A0AAV4A3F3_9GAST|nr:polypeptide n-acetylgalactosaminyltransferase [Plakobranchus ocellatus]